jgi:hypothetical protein
MFVDKDDSVEDAGIQFAQSLNRISFANSGDTNFFNFKVALEGFRAAQQQNPLTGQGLDQLMRNVESASVILDQSFQKLVNQMGQGANLATEIKQEFSEAAIEIIKLGGTEKDALDTQLDTLESMGRNVLITSERMTEFFATTRATGQPLKTLQAGFKDIGTSIYQIDDQMIKVIDTANRLGVSSKVVSKSVVENLAQLNRLGFENGIEGLAEMAAKSSALRVNMADVFKFADKVLSPEAAIDTAAALQRLGVTSSSLVDPLRLMDLAQNNVPELNEELGKMLKTYSYFDKQTQSFRIMPSARKDLKALEEAMGIPLAELEKLSLGAADLDKKMSEISFAGYGLDDETKQLVANLSELGEGGEYKITTKDASGQLIEQSVTQLLEAYKENPDQLKTALMEAQGDKEGSAEERMLSIAESQLDMLTAINKSNEAAMKSPAYSIASGVGQEMLKMNKILAKDTNDIIINALGPGSEFDKNMDESATSLKEAAAAMKDGDYSKMGSAIATAMKDVVLAGGSAMTTVATEIKGKIPTDFAPLNDMMELIKTQFPGVEMPKMEDIQNQIQNRVNNLFSSQQISNQSNQNISQNLVQQNENLGTSITSLSTEISNLSSASNNLLESSNNLLDATGGLVEDTAQIVETSNTLNTNTEALTSTIQNFYDTSESLISYVTNMNENTTINKVESSEDVKNVTQYIDRLRNETGPLAVMGTNPPQFSPNTLTTINRSNEVNEFTTKQGDLINNLSDLNTEINNTKTSVLNQKGGTSNSLFNFSNDLGESYSYSDFFKISNQKNETKNKFDYSTRMLTQRNKNESDILSQNFTYNNPQVLKGENRIFKEKPDFSVPEMAIYQPKKEKDLLTRVLEDKKETNLFSNNNTRMDSVATINGGEPLKVVTVIKFEGADKLSEIALSTFENNFKKTTFAQQLATSVGGVNFNINNSSPLTPSGQPAGMATGVKAS